MLPWQQKKALAQQREHKQIIKIAYNVAGIHGLFLLLVCFVGAYKPVLQLTLGSTQSSKKKLGVEKKFRADFCELNSFLPKINNLPKNSTEIKKEPPKTTKIIAKPILIPTTLVPQKSVAKKEEPIIPIKIADKPAEIAAKAPEKTIKIEKIVEPEKIIKALDLPKEVPAKIELEKTEELSLGIISQQEGAPTETNQASASHEIAAIITEQWHKVKGMPTDFSVDISFIINSSGKASSIRILNGYKSLMYQAHAKESLSRCQFPKKYYNKKCRIILKM